MKLLMTTSPNSFSSFHRESLLLEFVIMHIFTHIHIYTHICIINNIKCCLSSFQILCSCIHCACILFCNLLFF